MAEEDPDAAALLQSDPGKYERPEECEWPVWAEHIRQAWFDLRDDRHVGDYGGMGRIYFSSIAAYGSLHNINGEAFSSFLTFLRAIDDEYIAWALEKQKAEAGKKT